MIEIANLLKKHGDNVIYEDFNLTLENGKITVILGESGVGKTTLLKILVNATDFGGQVSGVKTPVSYVFQEDILIKNMTVGQNLSFICKGADVDGALDKMGLSQAKNLYPYQLSGGMKKRVNILRGILYGGKTLLLDEPFGNLDMARKLALIEYIKQNQKDTGRTVICVTHDIKEAVLLADRIIVLAKNKIIYDEKKVNKKTEDEIFRLMTSKEMLKNC